MRPALSCLKKAFLLLIRLRFVELDHPWVMFAKSATLFTPDRSEEWSPTVQRAGDVLMRVGDQSLGD